MLDLPSKNECQLLLDDTVLALFEHFPHEGHFVQPKCDSQCFGIVLNFEEYFQDYFEAIRVVWLWEVGGA